MVGDAEAAAHVDEGKVRELTGDVKKSVHALHKRICGHEQGTDVLVDPDKRQIVRRENLLHLGDKLRVHAEFGLLSGGDHLLVVSGADAGIKADGHLSAGIQAAEKLKLADRIHAHGDALVDGVLHLLRGGVVSYIEDFLRAETGGLLHENLAGGDRVNLQALGADNL